MCEAAEQESTDRPVAIRREAGVQTDRWAADGPECRRMLAVLLMSCAILPLVYVIKLATAPEPLFPDFFGLWSFGRYVLTHAPATIYDEPALHAFQTGFGMPPDKAYKFLYSPWILLLLAPIGALPYAAARIVWLVLTFTVYAAAVAAWRWQRPMAALLLLAPSSAVCFLVGQNGFLTATLMLGGMRLLPTRPFAAGVLLAAVGYKPQFAVLVPFVLLFGKHWRAMVGAGVAAAMLSLAVTLAFGPAIWGAWLATVRDQPAAVTAGRDALLDMMPTVTSAALLLGGGAKVAFVAQVAGALAGLLALWRVRGRQDAEAQAVLPLAALLTTPYAFHYDLPMTTGAVLAVIAARIAAAGQFDQIEFALLLACVAAPVLLISHIGGLATAALPAIFAGTLWFMQRPWAQTVAAPAPVFLTH